MNLLSKLLGLFNHTNSVNRESQRVYDVSDAISMDNEPAATESGTYDMYQNGINTTDYVEEGTLTGTAEDISAVLEAQSRRFGKELSI